jgi:TPR repeat protein
LLTMWFARALRVHRTAFPVVAASAWLASSRPNCESEDAPQNLRKRATVAKASATMRLNRTTTQEELSKIRGSQVEIFQRWELDEDGWRELPARAWPEFQPNPEQLVGIEMDAKKNGCDSNNNHNSSDLCQSLLFNVATGLVFYNVDPPAGLKQYEALAKKGHVDSMVACGVILTEGLGGIKGREQEGINWLRKAVSLGSTQGMYEMGTLLYTGIDGILYEDPEGAYDMFQKAAAKGHVGATYMMADCLIEGEGTDMDLARAIPLLYAAADQGHRYARQRIRELLKSSS